MARNLCILGSTGSIGTQALDVVRCLQNTEDAYRVTVLTANRQVEAMEAQIRAFSPKLAVMYDTAAADDLRLRVRDLPVEVLGGMEGLLAAVVREDVDVVLNAVVGMVGLRPTLAAIGAKKTLALANKETLVVGGALVTAAAKENGVKIYPVDSEHSAIFQCLQGCCRSQDLHKLILTASGGPFFGKTKEELAKVTPAMALKHPNWSMGAKITIDSATMMNKGLEIMEASWLFDVPEERIDVVVHRESVIHSMIEYNDHSVIAQLGVPDMRIPIQYALTYPKRFVSPVAPLCLSEFGKLTFFEPDEETFACLPLCREALRRGGLVPAAVNGANEAAVALFLQEKISFPAIAEMAAEAAVRQKDVSSFTVEDILEADRAARALVRSLAHCD